MMSLLIPLKNHPCVNLNIAETDLLKTYHVLLYKKISEENNLFRDFYHTISDTSYFLRSMPAPTKASGNKKEKNCRIKKTYSNSF